MINFIYNFISHIRCKLIKLLIGEYMVIANAEIAIDCKETAELESPLIHPIGGKYREGLVINTRVLGNFKPLKGLYYWNAKENIK